MSKKTNTLPERSQIPKNKTWDLDIFYKSLDSWEKDFKSLDTLLSDFMSCKGTLGKSAGYLKSALEKNDVLDRRLEKVYTYAHLRADEDTAPSGVFVCVN